MSLCPGEQEVCPHLPDPVLHQLILHTNVSAGQWWSQHWSSEVYHDTTWFINLPIPWSLLVKIYLSVQYVVFARPSNDPGTETDPKYANRHDDCVNWMPLSQLKGRTIKSNWCCVRQQIKKKFLIFPHFPKEGIAHLMFREILHWKDDWTIIFLLNSTHHLSTVNLILI